MTKTYDATKEHAPIDRSKKSTGEQGKSIGHPNKRVKGKNPYTGNTPE
jgi:hypothetical protein